MSLNRCIEGASSDMLLNSSSEIFTIFDSKQESFKAFLI